MTDAAGWSDHLAARLADRNPKCATCNFWVGPDTSRIRTCVAPVNTIAFGETVIHQSTTDLTVCSAWAPKEEVPF